MIQQSEGNMKENFLIRTMKKEELDFAIELAAKEGWNPGLYDASPFYSVDPGGFLIGLLNDKPVGCISAVAYRKKIGFIGFYIVLPEFRGKGYGIKIWNAGMKKLDGLNIALDGVFTQQENYKKSGFKLAYSNIRYQWKNVRQDYDARDLFNASTFPFDRITRYDKQFFPVDRSSFLKNWVNMPDSFAIVQKSGNDISGLGVIRKCRTGYKIGPLFADSTVVAENIFLELTNHIGEGELIFLDVPEVNEDAMNLVAKYKMKNIFGTARMYTGKIPKISVNRTYGVTTFELG
jgi:hypothetical protein